jgi:hypothetical protein
VGVPPTPSSLRVRVWRRLRSLGAVPLKRSADLLPDTPERYEDFQWLVQEIQQERRPCSASGTSRTSAPRRCDADAIAFDCEEARGLDVTIRALLAASPDDHQVLAQGMTLCEGLYATTSRR